MSSEHSFSIGLPYPDTVLRLTPRWSDLEPAGQVACLAASIVVPLVLVAWLYRYEMRLVSRATAGILSTLRLLVLAFLWFIICMQPVFVTTTTRELPTRALVAVDVSGSMNVTDPQRPAVDKLRLARALRLPVLGDEANRKRVDAWIKYYEQKGDRVARQDLPWIPAGDLPADAAERRRLTEERLALHDRICREVDTLTRTEIALRLLAADGGQLVKDLSGKHHVEILGFGDKVQDLTPEKVEKMLTLLQALKPRQPKDGWELQPEQAAKIFSLTTDRLDQLTRKITALAKKHPEKTWFLGSDQLDDLVAQVGPRAKPAPKKERKADEPVVVADSSGTDLIGPLERGLKPAGQSKGKLVGIVLLSDGRHNAAASPARTAEKLGDRKVPVYPVVVGTTKPRPRVTLTEVQAPPSASAKNVDVTVRVRFKVTGLERQNIVVSLERLDKRPGQPSGPDPITIAHDGEDQSYDKSFVLSMDPDGKPLQAFEVAVKPATRMRGGNLSQQVVIKMEDTKAKVLLVDGEARWEFHYLANALLRDPTLKVQRVLFAPPLREKDVSDAELRKMGNPERKLPAGPDALGDYQCIVLGDVAPEQLPAADRKRLEEFVANHGGTLVILAGKRFTPLAYAGLPAAAPKPDAKKGAAEETDPLLKLLPIEEPHVVKPAKGFPVTLTPDGKAAPFLRMEGDAAASEQRWAEFPPHYWAVVGKAKPAATTLAYFRDPDRPMPAAAIGKDKGDEEQKRSREESLIVRQNYGRGQVLYIGLDSTWRWRYRTGDTYHHRFWGQVMRWASADYVRFGSDKPVYQEGQDVTVALSLEGREGQEVPAAGDLKTRITRLAGAGQKEKVMALVPLSGQEGLRVLQGRVRNLPAGRYRVELDKPDPALAARLGDRPPATFLVTPRDNKEMDRLEADEDLMKSLAKKSGAGPKPYTPATAAEVVEQVTKQTVTRVERSEKGLWQLWWTLAIFLTLLTAEWVGRKWAGLP